MRRRPLPKPFLHTFRLFLRTAAATALHSRGAKIETRRLWRPSFVAARRAIRRLQSSGQNSRHAARLQDWYTEWGKRMSNTLSFLYTAAISRGIPNNVTRNLRSLARMHRTMRIFKNYPARSYWKGQLPVEDEKYQPVVVSARLRKQEEKRLEWLRMDFQAWGPLGEAIRMAEGRDGLLLGRVRGRVKPGFFRIRSSSQPETGTDLKKQA